MFIEHAGASPQVDPTAYVAPNAVLCGAVTIGPGCRILHGAQVIAESGSISIGRDCIVMENAVLRSSSQHKLSIGNHCLIGPNAHVVGCEIEDEVFIATGATIFHAARLGKGCGVFVNAIVHVKSQLAVGTIVPIGWIAVGNPVEILPCNDWSRIGELLAAQEFTKTVYGFVRSEATMEKITHRLSGSLESHFSDQSVSIDSEKRAD